MNYLSSLNILAPSFINTPKLTFLLPTIKPVTSCKKYQRDFLFGLQLVCNNNRGVALSAESNRLLHQKLHFPHFWSLYLRWFATMPDSQPSIRAYPVRISFSHSPFCIVQIRFINQSLYEISAYRIALLLDLGVCHKYHLPVASGFTWSASIVSSLLS